MLPATTVPSKTSEKSQLTYRLFTQPQPHRQIVLAWRKTFPRPKVIDLLRKTILACKLSGITPLDPY